MKCRNMGMPTNNNMVYTLCFVKDQVLIAQDYDDKNYKMRKLIENTRNWYKKEYIVSEENNET